MSLANKFGIPESLLDTSKRMLEEANEYQKKVQAHMSKKGIKSLNDLTGDQKKKFFNDLDAMHKAKNEEVESVDEQVKSAGKISIKNPRAYSLSGKKVSTYHEHKGQKYKVTSEEDRDEGHLHHDIHKVDHEGNHDKEPHYSSSSDSHYYVHGKTTVHRKKLPNSHVKSLLKAHDEARHAHGRKALHPHEEDELDAHKDGDVVEEVELTQEDLDFIASLNRIDEGSGPKEKQHDKYVDRNSEESKAKVRGARERMASDEKAKAGKKLLDKIKLKEEDVSLEDFTLDQIEEFMQTEEFEQLDELSKETLGSYVKKRSHDVAAMGAVTRKHAMDSEAARKDQNYSQAKKSNDLSNRAFMKGWKHRQGIARAVDKIVNKG